MWWHDDVIKRIYFPCYWIYFPCYWTFVRGNSPLTGEFPSQRPVTRSFDVFFDLHLNKRLSKQSRCRWFETPSRLLFRQCNAITSNKLDLWQKTTISKKALIHIVSIQPHFNVPTTPYRNTPSSLVESTDGLALGLWSMSDYGCIYITFTAFPRVAYQFWFLAIVVDISLNPAIWLKHVFTMIYFLLSIFTAKFGKLFLTWKLGNHVEIVIKFSVPLNSERVSYNL